MSELQIDMTVHIERAPADVFAAWSSAEVLASWFAPMAVDTLDVSMEFVVGGKYSIAMPLPDGSVHTTSGEFREIVLNQKIVMTWRCDAFDDPESVVEVSFSEAGAGTDLHLVHQRFESTDTCANHRMGWDACLGNLRQLLER